MTARILALGFTFTFFAAFAGTACSSDNKSSSSPDASAPDTGPSNTGDGASDACAPTPTPAAGLFQLTDGERNGAGSVMVLDSAGSPVVAYQRDTGDGSATSITINVRRWLPATCAWSNPIVVDTIGYQTGNGRQIALAYDVSSGAIGVAYQAVIGKFGDNDHYELRYAEIAKDAVTAGAPQRVDEPTPVDHGSASPGLGMANGKVFVAYQQPYRLCGTSGCSAIVYRERGTDGKWSSEVELPGNGPDANGDALENVTSVAVDAQGKPAVAWLSSVGAPGTGGVKMRATFVRPSTDSDAGADGGATSPSTIFENADTTGTDAPWIELAFDGTKPRAAVILNQDDKSLADGKTAWFVESDDGTTWKPAVALPHDNGSSLDINASIAIGSAGKVVIACDSNSSDGTDAFGSPKLLSSTDRSTFTVGGVPKSVLTGGAKWVSAKIGPDGKLQLVMKTPAGPDASKVGLVYWRED